MLNYSFNKSELSEYDKIDKMLIKAASKAANKSNNILTENNMIKNIIDKNKLNTNKNKL